MRRVLLSSLLLLAVALSTGCGATPGEETAASESELAASMVKIDPVPLRLDGHERLVDYVPTPSRFHAFEIHAKAGAELDIHVDARSPGARPAVWLTDAKLKNLAVTNDGSTSAHLHHALGAGLGGKLYVVIRDANLAAGRFAISGTGGDPGGGGACAGSCGGTQLTSLSCEPHTWRAPVPAGGHVTMAYGDKSWVFGQDAKSWSVVSNESAVTSAIPLPAGVTSMNALKVEMAPSGRPLVTFFSDNVYYAAIWDGSAFVKTVSIGRTVEAHADASERIYAVNENGLTEFAGGQQLVRGNLPFVREAANAWTVGADGTVYVLHAATRPSTIHPGDTANDLLVMSLPHGSLTWSTDSRVASNEGYGFPTYMKMAAAPDGSLHTAYSMGAFRSKDHGKTWDTSYFIDFRSRATMVDPATTRFDDDPSRVKGDIRLIAAEDYDHVSIALVYDQGSMSVPGAYFVRRCAPVAPQTAWPAERLEYYNPNYDQGGVAVNERGLATFITPSGVRQSALSP
jgi:hypothetical protein